MLAETYTTSLRVRSPLDENQQMVILQRSHNTAQSQYESRITLVRNPTPPPPLLGQACSSTPQPWSLRLSRVHAKAQSMELCP